MNFYEKEMRSMFEHNDLLHDAKFCGRTMLAKMNDDLRVKLQIISTHVADHYNAVLASVINRTDGVVDKQMFRFSDIIGRQMRTDRDEIEPHIWEYNGEPEWYIPITASQKAMIADTVLDYVGMYQEEGMDMGGMNL